MTTVNSPAAFAREILIELLRNGRKFGAQLKPLIEQALRARGIPPETVLGQFRKFSDFLAANADLLEITTPGGPGDIEVRLRTTPQPRSVSSDASQDLRPDRIRKELWQAVTNPDARRKRFLHRKTGEILHYLDGSPFSRNWDFAKRASEDPDFVEIDFARAEQQTAWMKEFLDSTPTIPDWTRRTAEHFLSVPYESSLNTAFVSALGDPTGMAWNRWRSIKVLEHVKAWAERRGVSLNLVLGYPQYPQALTSESTASESPAEASTPGLRAFLHQAIDEATEDELRQVVISPAVFARLLGRA